MKKLICDPFGGLAGDMLLGALLDLGAPPDELRAGLSSLGLPGWSLEVEDTERRGLGCTRARFVVAGEEEHRHLPLIRKLIAASALPMGVRAAAVSVFERLAGAEGRVHRIPEDEVHFHEVGAADAILDVCGVTLALHLLGAEGLLSGPLPAGTGTVDCAHGTLPVPVPAVVELCKGFTLLAGVGDGEMVTPTGAALLAALGAPLLSGLAYRTLGAGYGAGERPGSVVRAVLAEVEAESPTESGGYAHDEVEVLETHVDDATAESLGYLMERLFAAGALDVAYAPVVMKKSRPGIALTCIAPPANTEEVLGVLFTESTTLGVRRRRDARAVLEREIVEVDTPWGRARAKLAGGAVHPEHEDCARIAREHGVALRRVYEEVQGAVRRKGR